MQRGKRDIISRQLTRQIGSISPQLKAQIQNLSIEQLDALSEVLLDFTTTDDLTAWLKKKKKILN